MARRKAIEAIEAINAIMGALIKRYPWGISVGGLGQGRCFRGIVWRSLMTLLLAAMLLPTSAPARAAEGSDGKEGRGAALRVISLYPGHTENIAALGARAKSSLVAISHNDDLESLQHLPRLAANISPEAILAHAPDIVIMRALNTKSSPNLAPVLNEAGVKVYLLEPPSWDEFDEYLTELAEIIGADPRGALDRLSAVRDKVEKAVRERENGKPRPTVFLEATSREIHTCSQGSWPARLIEMCGGSNAAASAEPVREGSAIAPWGAERAVALLASGLDIYLVQQGAMNGSTREDVLGRPWFSPFKDGVRLEFIAERDLSRPSLLRLERGAEALLSIFAAPRE